MMMKMEDLDKLEQAPWASTVDVYMRVSITKILDIDTIKQCFQAEAFIESKWIDPNIKSISDPIDEKKIWKPDLYVENTMNAKDYREEVVFKIVRDSTQEYDSIKALENEANGVKEQFMICEIRKVSGLFYENLELNDFPLDVQDLTITVASKKPGKIVKLISEQDDSKEIEISNTLDKSMWKMHKLCLTQPSQIKREFSYGKRVYPAIQISSKVFRLPGFFYWNALLPLILVTFASLAPFVVDIKIPQSRLPSTCTLMLTSVSIRWTIGRLLPTVSYLTSLDKYSLATMMIITMELIYHASMGALFPKLEPNLAYALDKGAFGFFCLLILVEQTLFIAWVIKVHRFRAKVRKGEVKGLNRGISTSSFELTEKGKDAKDRSRLGKLIRNLRKKKAIESDDESVGEQEEGMIKSDKKEKEVSV